MALQNTYNLNLDIKKKIANQLPIYREGDTGLLNFRLFDDGVLFSLDGFTRAELVLRKPNNEGFIGTANLEDGFVKYQITGLEINEPGDYKAVLTIYSNERALSAQPFVISVFKNLKEETLNEISLLQNLVSQVTDLGVNAGNEIQRQNNEAQRISNEVGRIQSEMEREANENQRILRDNTFTTIINNSNFLGTYDETTQYRRHNNVFYEGSSYVALRDVVGTSPSNDGINWRLVAEKGEDLTAGVNTVNGVGPDSSGNIQIDVSDTYLQDINSNSTTQAVSANVTRQLNQKINRANINQKGELIAHRGLNSIANEQSQVSYVLAYENGIKSWEADIQNSSDNELFLIHDLTLQRTIAGNDPRTVTNVLAASLRQSDNSKLKPYYQPTVLLEFYEFLRLAKSYSDVIVYPEISPYQNTAAKIKTIETIINEGMENRAVIQSFNFETDFPLVRERSKTIVLGYLVDTLADFERALPLAEADGNADILINYQTILANPNIVQRCINAGVGLAAWTVNSNDTARELKNLGVSRILTDTVLGGYR